MFNNEETQNAVTSQEPPEVHQKNLASVYSRGEIQTALAQASELSRLYPRSLFLLNIIGVVNNKLGNFKEAIKSYEKALSIKPDLAEAYYNIGIALHNNGNLERAIEAYRKAISIKPDYAEAQNNMGNSFRKKGDLERAIDAYGKAISINPNYAEAYKNTGSAFEELGTIQKAKTAYRKAISIKPDYAEAHRILSSINKYTPDDGHFSQVKKQYDNANLKEEARCHLSFALAKMYDDMGDREKSYAF